MIMTDLLLQERYRIVPSLRQVAQARVCSCARALLTPLVSLALLVPTELLAQYAVGYRDTTIYRSGRRLQTPVYYPATSSGAGSPMDKSAAPYPLLVFAIGKRMQVPYYVTYYENLAAAGYVVMAPQFPDVDNPDAYVWNADLRACITVALNARTVPGSLFHQAIDPNRIGIFGHSFGGGTVVGVAADDERVRVTCAIAPNNPGNYSFFKMPSVRTPIHVMGGELDSTNSVDAIARPLYERGNPDKALVVVKGANHMQFSDYDGFDQKDQHATISRAQQLAITTEHLVNLFDAYLKGVSRARAELYGASTLTKNSVYLWFETQVATATRLMCVSGDDQSAPPGELTPLPLVFKVVDTQGNALARHTVHFQVIAGGGNLSGQSWRDLETDSDGLARIYPRLGSADSVANNLISVSAYKGTAHLAGSPRTITLSVTSAQVRLITVTTTPANVGYIVDSVSYTSPQTFRWMEGSTHTVSVPSPQGELNGTRYVFLSWSDGGEQTHSYLVPTRNDTLVATFGAQYLLTLASTFGQPVGGGWYNAHSNVTFAVDSLVAGGQGRRMSLVGWTGSGPGSYTGPEASATVVMDGPINESASWKTQFLLSTACNPSAGGTVVPQQPGAWYDSSATVPISATPAEGYGWLNWSGDLTTASNPVSLPLTRPVSVTANFVRLTLFTVLTDPPGLSFRVDSTDYSSPGSFAWYPGSQHTVSAPSSQQADSGVQYLFDHWSDGGASTHTVVTPWGDDTLVARFRTQYFLTVNSPYGSPTGQGWYDQGTQAAFSVTTPDSQAGTRHLFQNWSGDYQGAHPTGTVLMDRAKTVMAVWKTQHLLTLMSPYAQVFGSGWYDEGSEALFYVEPCVVPDSTGRRRVFVTWLGTGSGSYTGADSAHTVTMRGPITELAHWQTHYLLIVSSRYGEPTGGGWYPAGAAATFSVTTPLVEGLTRHQFTCWTGGFTGTEPTGELLMSEPRTVVAQWKDQFYLATHVHPPEGGTMTPDPPGGWFDADSLVGVQAFPSHRFAFAGWDGDLQGNSNPDGLLIDGPKDVTALFVPLGLVRITSEPESLEVIVDGVTQLVPQDFAWEPGSRHTLTAPSPQLRGTTRYTFQFWNDGGGQSHGVTVQGEAVFVAHYQTEYYLATACAPPEGGTVFPAPPGQWVASGESALIAAIPDTARGYLFASWSGDHQGRANPDTLTINGPRQVVANFIMVGRTRVSTVPEGLRVIADGMVYTAPREFTWEPGSTHTIAVESPQPAGPGVRYVFKQWSDGGPQSHSIIASGTAVYTAYFAPEYAVVTAVEPAGSGGVQLVPPSGWYEQGSWVIITALPDSGLGYVFAGWTGDLTTPDNPASLLVDGPTQVTAHFALMDVSAPVLLYSYPPNGAVYVPTNAPIELAVADAPRGTGVDPTSIVVTVNDSLIADGGSILPGLQATLRMRRDGITFRYQPAAPLPPCKEVRLRVRASDLATIPNALDTTISFVLASDPVRVAATQAIGPEGGYVTDEVRRLQAAIPSGALADTVVLTIAEASFVPLLPDSLLPVGPTYHLGPDGVSFADSVTLAIPYSEFDLAATGATAPTAIPVYHFDTRLGTWERLRVASFYRNFLFVRMGSFCYLLFCRVRGNCVAELGESAPPKVFSLSPGFPNPFNSLTIFSLDLPRTRSVRLAIYNACGQLVRSVEAGPLPAGSHRLQWDGRDDHGTELPSGLYLCQLEARPIGTGGQATIIFRSKVALVR